MSLFPRLSESWRTSPAFFKDFFFIAAIVTLRKFNEFDRSSKCLWLNLYRNHLSFILLDILGLIPLDWQNTFPLREGKRLLTVTSSCFLTLSPKSTYYPYGWAVLNCFIQKDTLSFQCCVQDQSHCTSSAFKFFNICYLWILHALPLRCLILKC